ncbi:hypothetical protein PILCRDRAFT_71406, partial [Piloderma croceum F 1598]
KNLYDDSIPVRPLIDQIVPMSALRAEYENGSASFVQQIDWLTNNGFDSVRRTRGDGDCFYRSIAFAYIERVMYALEPEMAVATSISTLESTLPMLELAGFQKMVFEDFYDILVSLVHQVVQPDHEGKILSPELLLEAFQHPEGKFSMMRSLLRLSTSVVVYLRLLTSAQIRADPDEYAPFLFHPELGIQMEPQEFCENFVESVGKEADHVQITALSRALQISVKIAYLDGRGTDGKVDFVDFDSAAGGDPLQLLYRPGHYDILVNSGKGKHRSYE